jgi:hypothetical protein
VEAAPTFQRIVVLSTSGVDQSKNSHNGQTVCCVGMVDAGGRQPVTMVVKWALVGSE